jgi:alpha-beta hydrolase superfamily lysophospholipase
LSALDPALVSRDPAVVQAYIDDPLVYKGKSTARLGAELISAIRRVEAEAATIALPVLIIQGSEDKLVDPEGAQLLYDRISSQDKTLNMYQGLFHEVCNEPECAIVLSDVEQWLETHIDLPQPSKGG